MRAFIGLGVPVVLPPRVGVLGWGFGLGLWAAVGFHSPAPLTASARIALADVPMTVTLVNAVGVS